MIKISGSFHTLGWCFDYSKHVHFYFMLSWILGNRKVGELLDLKCGDIQRDVKDLLRCAAGGKH